MSEYLELGILCENPVPVYALANEIAPIANSNIMNKEKICLRLTAIFISPTIIVITLCLYNFLKLNK